ncbi:Major Facilitator Superfamily protein [Streptococcus gallolyticus]|uniref:Major Facilitator Superfamily protein n=1 Tax=Streptococcus gallolyticus TaxID=315405 RepID=A0A1H7VD98_9STRE|nr:MFS transporter [Streptococcus gallolyticus]SEF21978.1 Major Facilitator Superfamily protein [Streptococcus gallolyticus]SEM06885.1 Major Facilitator Superfamily protein [Streptococcus gallolyticus]
MFKKSYRHNIALVGASEFFGFFGITSFWLLFLSQHGMSFGQIGILESLFHLTSLLSEVPSGVLADRFTYRTNLYLGRLMSILSCLFMLFGQGNFWIYAFGMVLNAWAYNFDSGTSTTMLFESAKEAGLENKFLKFSSFVSAVAEATGTLGAVVAGFFVHGLLDMTYIIQIFFSLIVIILIVMMKEPTFKKEREEPASLSRILKTVVREFKVNRHLFYWLITSQVFCVMMCMFYFYYQNELEILPSWQISLLMLISSVINIGAVWLSSKIGQRFKAVALLPILVGLTGMLYVLAITKLPLIYMIIYLMADGLYAFFLPIFNNDLQVMIPSDVRATMLSVTAMFFSLFMIVIFPMTGFLIDWLGFSLTFLLLGIVLMLLAPLLILKRNDLT